MNDLSGFWEHKEEEKKEELASQGPALRGKEDDASLENIARPGLARVAKEEETAAVVEKTRRQLPTLPAGPKRILLAAVILLVFGVLIGTNLPRRESGEKLLLDIKKDIGEEAKLAGAALDEPELAEGNEAPNAAVLGTAETGEGRIKVLSANLVGIWQKKENQDGSPQGATPTVEPSPTPEATESATPEATESAKVEPSNEIKGSTLNAELGDEEATSAALPAPDEEKPELTLAGVRIMGEIQNVGGSTVYEANAFVRFYDQNKNVLAIKVGEWSQGYKFLPLAPEVTGVYDVVVLNPPEFETVTIEMKVDIADKRLSLKDPKGSAFYDTESLKVKSKALEPTTTQQGNQQINYFTFNGTLVNKGKAEIVNPAIYVWLKNREGKVIGLAAKTLASDLLLPEQELSVSLFVIPVTTDEMASFEVRTFGEQL